MDPNMSPSPSSCGPMTTPASTDGSDIMGSFDTDQGDLALATVPGQDAFDPHSHRFSEDELKPQPMIKKARKMMVPEDLKVSTKKVSRKITLLQHLCSCGQMRRILLAQWGYHSSLKKSCTLFTPPSNLTFQSSDVRSSDVWEGRMTETLYQSLLLEWTA